MGNKIKFQGIFLLCLILLLVIIIIYPDVKRYKYYKSEKFEKTAWRIQNQFYNMFLYEFYREPSDGNEFLNFCNETYLENFYSQIDNYLLKDGIDININNDSVIIYSLGMNNKGIPKNDLLNSNNLKLIPFLLNKPHIIICKFKKYSVCDIQPTEIRIFKDSLLLNRNTFKDLYNLLRIKIDSITMTNIELQEIEKMNNDYILLKGVNINGSLQIDTVCMSKDYLNKELLLNDIQSYFNNNNYILNGIDYFYFPVFYRFY